MKNDDIWTAEEARAHFSEFLKASSERGPQTISEGERTYVLTLVRAHKLPSGMDILRKGGPLSDDDSIDFDES